MGRDFNKSSVGEVAREERFMSTVPNLMPRLKKPST